MSPRFSCGHYPRIEMGLFFMATLHRRLTHYCFVNKKPELTEEQKSGLGRIIIEAYCAQKKPTTPIHHELFTNETGSFKVVSYPRYFIPEIDRFIADFYQALYPPAPKRKRIPAKSKPVYSTKNYPNNG